MLEQQLSSRTEGGSELLAFLPLFDTTSCAFCRRVIRPAPDVRRHRAGDRGGAASRADVSHVEVNHILRVGPLDRDGEGFKGVESEGHQTSDRVVDRPPQKARLDFKLQQAGVTSIKPVWGVRKRNQGTGLLHM